MQEISYKDLKFNPFNLIGDEWMLITAGDEHSWCLSARRSMPQKSSQVASSIRKPLTRVIRRATITPCTSVRSRRYW